MAHYNTFSLKAEVHVHQTEAASERDHIWFALDDIPDVNMY